MSCISTVVRYSYRGCERAWPFTLTLENGDSGPSDAAHLKEAFAAEAEGGSNRGVQIRVVPARPGGPQLELAPVQGQGLAAFLGHSCRDDNGVFQLRATFDAASGEEFMLVRVVFPGMVPQSDTSISGESIHVVEEFECEKNVKVIVLKQMIEARTHFPPAQGVLLHGCRRLHDQQQLAKFMEVVELASTPLQYHISASGSYLFLRREGQGHCMPTGPCTLTLQLPSSTHGARDRQFPFNPQHQLDDLRKSIQGASGLPPVVMHLALVAPMHKSLACEDRGKTLETLGFTDGCTLEVQFDLTEDSLLGEAFDISLDVSAKARTSELYKSAAAKLGIGDASSLVLVAGDTTISSDGDLSALPLADGVVLSAYMALQSQLTASVFIRRGGGSSSSSSDVAPPLALVSLACHGANTIAEVRELFCRERAAAAQAPQINSSLVFAVDSSMRSEAVACHSLRELARLLGHFSPCSDRARLSRLGITNGMHMIFVPDRRLVVLLEIRLFDGVLGERKVRVESSSCLRELRRLLQQELRARPFEGCPSMHEMHCQWSVSKSEDKSNRGELPKTIPAEPAEEPMSTARSAAQTFTGIVNTAIQVVKKRRSFGGAGVDSGAKRPRLDTLLELSEDSFIGDVQFQHPVGPVELPSQFCCPISLEVMQDPVIVAGSGNTYERKTIERHFRTGQHRDPLHNTSLRTAADRRLIPNNSLKSQIREAQQAQVELRLVATFGKKRR